ncbi:MAG TPA: PilZ domain-containing protein [Spirochaetota bacterium]|nr:PilZ domain-containing protein [Spirochaetota bacterium]HNT10798.1 PilZ domain-containing protein [Spirochaetota bacterium]HPU89130.1 PilZ domain-containing protein [Spirochaetota bacterium]
MKKRVTFEDLSKDIKEAIEAYRVAESGSDAPIDREQAMDAWFRERFESWIADRMGTAEGENKRRHHRFDIELPLSISDTIIESSGEEPHVSDLLGTIVNISRGGFYFFAPRAVPVSSILRVTIDFSGFDPGLGSIEALAMVMRSEPKGRGRFGIGVMFSSIYDDNRESLELFIFKHLAYRMHASQDAETGPADGR